MADTPVDWNALRDAAVAMTERSYAPYSKFHVGAAALTTSGRIVTGCNVENISYGLSLCAECGLISQLISSDAGQIVALYVVSGSGDYCAPCGRCRQLLVEHIVPGAELQTSDGPIRIADLLPGNFDLARLEDG